MSSVREAFAAGVMFQLHDDLLDLTTSTRGAAWWRATRLYEGKVSALVVEHLARAAEAAALVTLLGTRARRPRRSASRGWCGASRTEARWRGARASPASTAR
ncbi:MAG: hypothetical protein U0325_36205 [Polyangiales bacterium]